MHVPSQANEDAALKEEEHNDRLRYNTLKKSGNFDVLTIFNRNANDRIADEDFFVMMWISTSIPFFFHYDKKSIDNLCRCVKVR